MPIASLVPAAMIVFIATNVDDLFVIAAFLTDPHLPRRAVFVGQFVGIGTLVLLSSLAALMSLAIPLS
jgi:cadmium resistance protein CadD (predicted permease)